MNAQSSLCGMKIFTFVLRTVCAMLSLRLCRDDADCMLYLVHVACKEERIRVDEMQFFVCACVF